VGLECSSFLGNVVCVASELGLGVWDLGHLIGHIVVLRLWAIACLRVLRGGRSMAFGWEGSAHERGLCWWKMKGGDQRFGKG